MSQLALGQATIIYDDPEEGRSELTVDNEHVVYVRDHWAVRTETDEDGNDVMRQIPRDRVHYVERTVEQFEDETASVRDRLESAADVLRQRLPGTSEPEHDLEESEPIRIEEPDESESSTDR